MSSSTFNPENSNPLSNFLKYADAKSTAPAASSTQTYTKLQLLDIWNEYLQNLFIANSSFDDYLKHTSVLQNTGLADEEKQKLYLQAQKQAQLTAFAALKKFNKHLIQIDMENYANIITSAQEMLHQAVTKNDINKLQEALTLLESLDLPAPAKKALLSAKFYRSAGENCRPALVQASTNGSSLDLVEALFNAGADANVLIPENKLPLFFEVTTNRVSSANPDAESISYIQLKKHIELFLSSGYDINLVNSAKLNFLTSLFKNSSSNQLPVAVNIAVNKIVELFDQGQISPSAFKKFCEETPQIKLFPNMVDRYMALPLVSNPNIGYQSDAERQHYMLHSLLINAISFSLYTKNRVQHTYFSGTKLAKLDDVISRLQSLHLDAFMTVREMIDHHLKQDWDKNLPEVAAKLNKLFNEVTDVTKISRISFFSDPSSFSDWSLFQKSNAATLAEVSQLQQAANASLTA